MTAPTSAHHLFFKWIVILVVGNCCLASPSRILDDRERLINIAERVDAIDNKLNSLTSGQGKQSLLIEIDQKLDSIDQKLDLLTQQNGTIATVTFDKTDGGQQINETRQKAKEEQEDFPHYHCVNLISVERSPTSNGNNFTLRFTKNAEEIVYYQVDGKESPIDAVEGNDGVWSVNITCDSERESEMCWFTFGDKVEEEGWSFLESRRMMHLALNNTGNSQVFQQMEALPDLHMDPPRAAIYEPGEDINVTAFIPANDLLQEIPYIYESVYGINMSSGEIYMDMGKEMIIRDIDEDSEKDEMRKTVTILTSSTTVSGYFSFSFMIHLEGPVVSRIHVKRVIELRPSNQRNLPSGYLGVINTPFMGKSEDGNELIECRKEEECKGSCYGVGETISDMNVVKVLADGSHEAVPSAFKPNETFINEHFQIIMWKFQAEEDSEDNDGIATFQCSASDETHNKEATKLVDVLFLLEDGIDEERSNVTVRDDDMNPDTKYITFNCAVYGRPLPEVNFASGTSYIFNMDSYEPDSFVVTGRNKAVATKTLTLDMYYLRNYNYRVYEDDELPSCAFYSKTRYEYLEHTFQVADLGLEN